MWMVLFWLYMPSTQQVLVEARIQRQITPALLEAPLSADKILTFGQIGHPDGLSFLRPLLVDPQWRQYALFAWGEIEGAPLSDLLTLKIGPMDAEFLLWVEALSKTASSEDQPALLHLWQSWPAELQDQTLFYFFRMNDPVWQKAIQSRLGAASVPGVGTLFYLARQRLSVPTQALIACLDRYAKQPESVCLALRISPDEPNSAYSETLLKLLMHEDWRVRVEVLRAAQKNKAFELAIFQQALTDPNPLVISTALGGLLALAPETNLSEAQIQNLSASALFSYLDAKGNQVPWAEWVKDWPKARDWKARQYLRLQAKWGAPETTQSLFEKGSSLEKEILLSSLPEESDLAGQWIHSLGVPSDPFLLAEMVNQTAQRKLDPKPGFLSLLPLSFPEIDPQYAILDNLASFVAENEVQNELQKLVDHPQYLVRLKALNLITHPSLTDRSRFLGKGNSQPAPENLVIRAASGWTSEGPEWIWQLQTEKGLIHIRLYWQDAPITCANISLLSQKHYFDNMAWHRVVPNFVLQGGDVRGDGSGGPGYAIPCEINPKRFKRGTVGMALAGKDTGGSQFFICHAPQPHLDGGYTVFGEVVLGMEVVDQLEQGDTIQTAQVIAR